MEYPIPEFLKFVSGFRCSSFHNPLSMGARKKQSKRISEIVVFVVEGVGNVNDSQKP